MALPMVHLHAAWLWAQDKPELRENPDYYLGSISPDAIHVRDGSDKSRKNAFHLNNWRAPDPDSVLRYWIDHHTPFDIGYGIHVLLDGQWAAGFRHDFPEMLLPDGRPNIEIYYNDTCIADFDLFNNHPLTPRLMELTRQGKAPDDHPLLTADEFIQWREDTFKFYDRPCPMTKPVRYIDSAYVQRFLGRCGKMMDITYERMKKMNPVQQAILDRRSNRGYSDVPLTEAEIQMLVDAALASPTACNYQDWHFIFNTDREMLDEFAADYLPLLLAKSSEADKAKYAKYDVLFRAPLLVVITLPKEPLSRFAEVDAGIAVQNLAIAAQGMGLGSVILGRPKEVFTSAKGAEWEKRFGFPEGHRFAIAIAIGHPTMTKDAHPVGEGKVSFVK